MGIGHSLLGRLLGVVALVGPVQVEDDVESGRLGPLDLRIDERGVTCAYEGESESQKSWFSAMRTTLAFHAAMFW